MLEHERPIRTVLFGIGPELPENVIKAELAAMGYEVVYFRRLRSSDGNDRSETNISIARSANSESIFTVERIRGLRCKFEHKRPDPHGSLCGRCQKPGHSARFCARPFVCGFCAGAHHTDDCAHKEDRAHRRCANCGGAHPAFVHNCPARAQHAPASATNGTSQAAFQHNASRFPGLRPAVRTAASALPPPAPASLTTPLAQAHSVPTLSYGAATARPPPPIAASIQDSLLQAMQGMMPVFANMLLQAAASINAGLPRQANSNPAPPAPTQ